MRPSARNLAARALLLATIATVASTFSASPGWAQGSPAAPVRFTPARAHSVRVDVSLPGTVESRTASLVAAEVEGLVVELTAREGMEVAKGQSLGRLRTENLELRRDAMAGQRREAEARLERARLALERARNLRGEDLVSEDSLEEATAEFNAWEGRIDQLQAEIDRVELDIQRCSLRSPLAGVVVSEQTEVGEWIAVGQPVVEIVSLDELEIAIDVPERFFHRLRLNDAAVVTFDVIPGFEIEGTIGALIPRASARARTFPTKVRIPNVEHRISVGMLAHVSLAAGASYDAVIVPKDAVVAQGPARFVYRIGEEDVVEQVAVTPGDGVGSWIAVEGEIFVDDRIITRGNERVRPGQKVSGEVLEYDLP